MPSEGCYQPPVEGSVVACAASCGGAWGAGSQVGPAGGAAAAAAAAAAVAAAAVACCWGTCCLTEDLQVHRHPCHPYCSHCCRQNYVVHRMPRGPARGQGQGHTVGDSPGVGACRHVAVVVVAVVVVVAWALLVPCRGSYHTAPSAVALAVDLVEATSSRDLDPDLDHSSLDPDTDPWKAAYLHPAKKELNRAITNQLFIEFIK